MKILNKYKMVLSIGLALIITVSANSSIVSATERVGVGVSDDFRDNWLRDVEEFADTIINELGWYEGYFTDTAIASEWQEETYSGTDDEDADFCQLSLLLAHGHPTAYLSYIEFSYDAYFDDTDTIRLGYATPSDTGYNIWAFFITCYLLRNPSYPSWSDALDGTHMMLGFTNSPNIVVSDTWGDATELAYRLIGLDGEEDYDQENVQNSFFNTYVQDDGIHGNNYARILAENSSVANNDWIDSYSSQITVDNSYTIIDCYIP